MTTSSPRSLGNRQKYAPINPEPSVTTIFFGFVCTSTYGTVLVLQSMGYSPQELELYPQKTYTR